MAGRRSGSSTPRASAAFLVGMTALGAAVALPFFGKMGLLIGALGGVCVATVIDATARARRNPHLKSGAPIDLAGLDEQQQLAMLGQGLRAGSDFRSELLKEASAIETEADDDLEAALRRARELREANPRAVAAWRLSATLARRAELDDEADEARTRALELAADGGMNQLLVELYDETPQQGREALALTRNGWSQLARALSVRERTDEARAAMERAEAIDPELDAERRRAALAVAAAALRAKGEDEAADISDLLAAGRDF